MVVELAQWIVFRKERSPRFICAVNPSVLFFWGVFRKTFPVCLLFGHPHVIRLESLYRFLLNLATV